MSHRTKASTSTLEAYAQLFLNLREAIRQKTHDSRFEAKLSRMQVYTTSSMNPSTSRHHPEGSGKFTVPPYVLLHFHVAFFVHHKDQAAPMYRKGAFQYKTTHEAEGQTTTAQMTMVFSFYISAIYGQIPPDTEILLTHTPPYLTLDKTRQGKHAGCEQLAESMKRLEACRLHVFGHIHDAHGAQIEPSQRVSVNAAMCLGAKPIIVDLRN
jgi:hypothetical protein